MADKLWVGADDDWATSGNWSPVDKPIAGDDVYITGGTQDIAAYSEAIALGRLVVGAGYSGSIAELTIDASSIDYSGQGTTAIFKGTYPTVTVQDTSTSDTALKIDGSGDLVGVVRILGGKGTVTLGANCEITGTIEQIGASGVTTIIQDGITLTTVDIICDSGKLQINEAPTNLTLFGGDVDALLDAGTVTAVDIYGGRLRWSPTASCIITTLTVYSGTFASRESAAPEFTITNSTVHEAGIIDERSGLENARFYNPVNMEGGRIHFDIGRSITLA